MTQMMLLRRHMGLFVGASMQDPNIRRLIDAAHRKSSHSVHDAILKRDTPLSGRRNENRSIMMNLMEDIESRAFEKVGIRIIRVDSFQEIPDLIRRIC